ncbi:3-alpha-(or 20-beta)-hydroxysteroid dehydrogenase [Paraburkholderia domus]|jgi:Dehydrogenases with different specificities (related to short-chain alcohol dehydrogenases)|uniref:3-alpha-(Or 20-beta)-hydroxysteroid dehydrogenase n=1 Tax=Paraburkholderia domus TaxID=2793075 RepID=A0A9N8NBC9_9BURK|nr:glucose 1-dehydrogenase [Paraburkholderia domus]MBK5053117.1 glucose 1-dehydrogenase [Burkholderia sp. R-70006]MBK5065092.1 glucose 1-dehydrogenase [Burkholderia sp. R-70199]MBK5090266.1 glucose 1-dehydrogenase [Burkholderia sp. R-69927]MBK5124745.1 glucose 1-dehydrogenase [Burkholderia sp. R-69980]MBK5168995.1 glucose 1-dehydrogenase [Burkholderia sp. R-70211]MBK5184200.1 glucose 1-dehydrogenase [Burkholderia sp. R-69749]MCI0150609.1 glucose 1-dehydrogenase [Paraburkholderia sediminicola
MGRLANKVAIVTGGARGMGEQTCRLFAQEGARVVIADVLEAEGEALARELGDAACFMHLDVSDEANWESLVAATLRKFERIDVLVNNAAVLVFGEITALTKRDFERAVSINLVGTFLGIRTVATVMKSQRAGSIVNISSVDGLRGVNALAAYVSSKWGVRGLTKVAALELGHHGVRVNSIHPGGVNTLMSNPGGVPVEEVNKAYKHVPMQRVGEPDEIARATLFLASDEASYCNGSELSVDGGMAAGSYYAGLPGAPV